MPGERVTVKRSFKILESVYTTAMDNFQLSGDQTPEQIKRPVDEAAVRHVLPDVWPSARLVNERLLNNMFPPRDSNDDRELFSLPRFDDEPQLSERFVIPPPYDGINDSIDGSVLLRDLASGVGRGVAWLAESVSVVPLKAVSSGMITAGSIDWILGRLRQAFQ